MAHLVNTVLLPGDVLNFNLNNSDSNLDRKVTLGPGINRVANKIIATKPGILRHKNKQVYWIDSHQKRYIPVKSDHVIGIVTQKSGDIFRVDVGTNDNASLSFLNFEGASKRNRPDVKVGDLLYTRLITADKHMETELTCVDGNGKCGCMGVIQKGGFMFHCSLNLVTKLLSKDCNLLKSLGSLTPFESAIGLNGRVWLNGRSTRETIALSNAICAAEFMTNKEIKSMCLKLSSVISGAPS